MDELFHSLVQTEKGTLSLIERLTAANQDMMNCIILQTNCIEALTKRIEVLEALCYLNFLSKTNSQP